MDEGELPADAVAAAVGAARALMRGGAGEDVLLGELAQAAILLSERFCARRVVMRTPEDRDGWRWDKVPPPIRMGIAMLVQHLFEARGGTEAPPGAVAALWRPYRRMRLRQVWHP